jgi:hypothetical protein
MCGSTRSRGLSDRGSSATREKAEGEGGELLNSPAGAGVYPLTSGMKPSSGGASPEGEVEYQEAEERSQMGGA